MQLDQRLRAVVEITMKYEDAIRKPFTDGKKLIIGIALSTIPIVSLFAKGFILNCSGIGKSKSSKKMPEWNDWGDLFLKGLLAWIVGVIYLLPALILVLMAAGNIFAAAMPMMGPHFQMMMGPGGFEKGGEELGMMFENNWPQLLPALFVSGPLFMIAALLGLLGSFVAPSAIFQYLKKERFGDAFQFGTVFEKAFKADYFVAWLVAAIIGVVTGIILGFIPLVGHGASSFIGGVIGFTILGEAYRKL